MVEEQHDRCALLNNHRKYIHEWRKQRIKRTKRCHDAPFFFYSCSFDTLRVFVRGINIMVILQILLACVAVYFCKVYGIRFASDAALIVSPVVFPLAFSINTDFHRREKVLEYLGNFKSSTMICYFCMRDWRKACGFDDTWFMKVDSKLKDFLINIRDYLQTCDVEHRKVLIGVIYEEFSEMNLLFETIRTSKLPYNSPLLSRLIHCLKEMCTAFERLQIIREYRSSRTIRSFNKVMILLLPIIFAPYFLHLGNKSENEWSAFYIAVVVTFTFSALQGVQDKLDDPFDLIGEDDIDLRYFDQWMSKSLNTSVMIKEERLQKGIERKCKESEECKKCKESKECKKCKYCTQNSGRAVDAIVDSKYSLEKNDPPFTTVSIRESIYDSLTNDKMNYCSKGTNYDLVDGSHDEQISIVDSKYDSNDSDFIPIIDLKHNLIRNSGIINSIPVVHQKKSSVTEANANLLQQIDSKSDENLIQKKGDKDDSIFDGKADSIFIIESNYNTNKPNCIEKVDSNCNVIGKSIDNTIIDYRFELNGIAV